MLISEGGLVAQGLDRSDECNISILEWINAARVAVDCIRRLHNDKYANALAAHHLVVLDLANRQGAEAEAWPIAMAYDIHQRETAAAHTAHDLSTLDPIALQLVTNQRLVTRLASATHSSTPAYSPLVAVKRAVHQGIEPASKRQRTAASSPSMCFRCSNTGHLPKECSASHTKAGKPVVALSTDAKHPNGLVSTSGKTFCFHWARDSSCHFSDSCMHFHGCSICSSLSHGAQACPI